jgi:hypothetical protein
MHVADVSQQSASFVQRSSMFEQRSSTGGV